ncbi:MAG TPA: hypothetical protein PKA90_11705 [Ignavibacteria bacterium]|nr:hypothetical protein [Ignavibacteria bacterium]HMR41084.1 hypothetical protein [Ignavibacteria bacterium]
MKSIFSFLVKEAKSVFSLTLLLAFAVIFISADLTDQNTGSNKFISPEWNQFQTVSLQDSLTTGTPVQGEPGITVTVQEIMNEEAMLPADYYAKPKPKTNPEFEIERPEKSQNPDAPGISQWPPRNEEQKNVQPEQTDNPQTIGTSFLGPKLSESGYIPPDSQGDVGPTQAMVCANGRIKVFSKAGVLGGLNSDLDVFFNSVRNGSGISDPHIRYDRLTARWFVVAINLQAAPNRVVIAVSSGSAITSQSSFTFYQFMENLPGAINGFADYPTLGVDKFALYIGMNMFNAAGTAFLGTNGYVIRKSDLLSGTLTTTAFTLVTSGAGIYTPQGVHNDDPSATEGYFIGVDTQVFSLLVMKRVTNPGGTPSISGNLNITVPTTVYPETVPHNGSSARLDALDDRLFAAEIHKNKITGAVTLWTAHNIEVNSSGVASTSGSRDAGRWYEITNLTTTPSINQSGTLYDPAGSSARYYWIPSVAMSGQGHMAMGCSSAGSGRRAEIYTAGRFRTDPLGTIQSSILAQSSSTGYSVQGGTQRWGDYSQTVVDPNDDMTMWTFQEYCDATNSWGVRAIQLIAPPPATPSASDITNIAAGQSSVNIVITGTSVSGSEFFDPGADAGGPGYANHIAASISGSVTVNSISFDSPTQVTLNISTVGSPVGSKNITITNPDGQQTTGNNLINVTSPFVDLNLTSFIEGFYNSSSNSMVRDTMRVLLRNNFAPYAIVDSGKTYLTTSGTGTITFANASNGVDYYLQLKHRNALETWSKSPGQSFSGSVLNYNFSTSSAQAFGSNMPMIDASPVRYGEFGGDVNQNGVIDLNDIIIINNAAGSFASGYVVTDLDGNNIVELSDVIISYNNASNFVLKVTP